MFGKGPWWTCSRRLTRRSSICFYRMACWRHGKVSYALGVEKALCPRPRLMLAACPNIVATGSAAKSTSIRTTSTRSSQTAMVLVLHLSGFRLRFFSSSWTRSPIRWSTASSVSTTSPLSWWRRSSVTFESVGSSTRKKASTLVVARNSVMSKPMKLPLIAKTWRPWLLTRTCPLFGNSGVGLSKGAIPSLWSWSAWCPGCPKNARLAQVPFARWSGLLLRKLTFRTGRSSCTSMLQRPTRCTSLASSMTMSSTPRRGWRSMGNGGGKTLPTSASSRTKFRVWRSQLSARPVRRSLTELGSFWRIASLLTRIAKLVLQLSVPSWGPPSMSTGTRTTTFGWQPVCSAPGKWSNSSSVPENVIASPSVSKALLPALHIHLSSVQTKKVRG